MRKRRQRMCIRVAGHAPGFNIRSKNTPTILVYTTCGRTQVLGAFPPSEARFLEKP
jgi:hypothetical protein